MVLIFILSFLFPVEVILITFSFILFRFLYVYYTYSTQQNPTVHNLECVSFVNHLSNKSLNCKMYVITNNRPKLDDTLKICTYFSTKMAEFEVFYLLKLGI